MKGKILVVGGAGYIGSHMSRLLIEQGWELVIFDNLSTGFRDAVIGGRFVLGDLNDKNKLSELFVCHRFDAVMHFASLIQVGESVKEPIKYYQNNVTNTLNLLDTMVAHGVDKFIFSSSAAVYGNPRSVPIKEEDPKLPLNPYGRTKWMVEQILRDYSVAYGLKSVSLRYFNAAGADPDGLLGERHEPETHLIPLVLRVAAGRMSHICVFGTDYGTADGTCIRDYVHVADLCRAHLLALERLQQVTGAEAYNLGNGAGFSVFEVIKAAEKVTGKPVRFVEHPRRPGDPEVLVANARRAAADLDWKPRYPDLQSIIDHAWKWETRELRAKRINS